MSPYHYLKIINDHFGLFMLYVSQGIKTHYPETISLNDLNFNAFMSNMCSIQNESDQMKQALVKFQSLIEDGNLEELSAALSEIESIEDMQEEYMIQLETEQMLLINKITELGQEVFSSSPPLSRMSSDN